MLVNVFMQSISKGKEYGTIRFPIAIVLVGRGFVPRE
jgi:hypothetical protein